MDDTPAITVDNLSKSYRIWATPAARLAAPVWAALGRRAPAGSALQRHCTTRAHGCYQDFHALRGVTFTVARGEAVGIVGLNGSGKSTLLQLLAGTLAPTGGSCRVHGRVAALLELGAGFNFEFTGRENVFLNASLLGLSREEMRARFPAVEAFAEIGEFLDRPVKTYSSGMVVRLGFAVLTQLEPDVLIVDEALAVGDAYFQHKCAAWIRTFRASGRTLLFVSHDPGAVKELCDRALLLDHGVLVREGPAEAVLDYYNAIVARKERDAAIRQVETQSGRTLTRSGNRKAEITSYELTGADGLPARAFTSGDRARLTARVVCHAALERPTFGLLLRDRLGHDVFGTNTHHIPEGRHDYAAGDVMEIAVDLTLHLGPGSYSVTLAVHANATHVADNYDWLDHVLVFQILPVAGRHVIGNAALPFAIAERRVPAPTSPAP